MIMPPIDEHVHIIGEDTIPSTPLDSYPVPRSMSPLGASLLSGLPSLLGGGLGALSQFVTNQINYKRQMDMYRENREYNSPAAQMQRFKDAGLNPNLIYGQSNTAQPVSVGTSVAPDFSFIGSAAQQSIDNFRNTETQTISNAIQLTNYIMSRVNLDYLPNEKKTLFRQLERITLKALADYWTADENWRIAELDRKLKQLNYDYDLKQYQKGFAPDLDPKTRSIIGIIGQALDYLNIIPAEQFNKFIFQTQ